MPLSAIKKPLARAQAAHYLENYESACRSFSWEGARAELAGLPNHSLNMAHEAIDRHVLCGQGARLAARFVDRSWQQVDLSYAELQARSNRFANLLQTLGLRRGECVATLLVR